MNTFLPNIWSPGSSSVSKSSDALTRRLSRCGIWIWLICRNIRDSAWMREWVLGSWDKKHIRKRQETHKETELCWLKEPTGTQKIWATRWVLIRVTNASLEIQHAWSMWGERAKREEERKMEPPERTRITNRQKEDNRQNMLMNRWRRDSQKRAKHEICGNTKPAWWGKGNNDKQGH